MSVVFSHRYNIPRGWTGLEQLSSEGGLYPCIIVLATPTLCGRGGVTV